jgi:hypothetical protein
MLITNKQMFESVATLAEAKDEKGMLGYAIAVNLRKLTTEVREYSHKRDELLAEYGTAVEGNRYNLTAAAAQDFHKALAPYAELETDVAVMQVPPEVFYSGGLTSAQMYALAWMVKEEG